MRTTVNIDDHLLAEAKVIAARTHRTIGSVLEEALRKLIEEHLAEPEPEQPFRLPRFETDRPGLRPGVDLENREQMYELMYDERPFTI